MTLAEVKGELINIVLRIAIAEDKPGVKHSIITGWKISEARFEDEDECLLKRINGV